jgi:hypothetical protein
MNSNESKPIEREGPDFEYGIGWFKLTIWPLTQDFNDPKKDKDKGIDFEL